MKGWQTLIQDSNYKVLITTSGIGSRLGDLTEFTNKSLIVIGDKPAISYIVESYPTDSQFVITLGHFGSHVKQFLEIAYPNRYFQFIDVSPYKGVGSSLAFSMLQAKEYLQSPFIYHASDSILIDEFLPIPAQNWVAGQKNSDGTNYASFDANFSEVTRFHDKGMVNFDFLHIGVIGVHDYESFWNCLEKAVSEKGEDETLNDLSALSRMLSSGIRFDVIEVSTWLDIGNSHALQKSREILSSTLEVLPKSNESISFINGKVIKFFSDADSCKNRVLRAKDLQNIVPDIIECKTNFYSYEFIEGEVASKKRNPSQILNLLDWANLNLWTPRVSLAENEFLNICKSFYLDKSRDRINTFLETRGIKELPIEINEQLTPPVLEILEQGVDIAMSDLRQSRIHGDFILDNIVVSKDTFILIDWRQDFGGSLESGDMYYDLAKLNHSLHVNHEFVKRNLFEIELRTARVECGIQLKDSLFRMKKYFDKWMLENQIDIKKVDVLTCLIWLNMAPLHHHPFDQFLYYYGRYNLWRHLHDS
jgi:dTDP-glucose pyrophosphorylase